MLEQYAAVGELSLEGQMRNVKRTFVRSNGNVDGATISGYLAIQWGHHRDGPERNPEFRPVTCAQAATALPRST